MALIQIPYNIAGAVVLVPNVANLPPAASVRVGSIRVTEDTGTLYVSDGAAWSSGGGGGGAVDSVNGLTGIVVLQVGDGTIGSTNNNILAYSNSSGELDNLAGWGVDTVTGGLNVGVTQNVDDSGYKNFNFINMVLEPSIASPTSTYANLSQQIQIDPSSSGLAIGTSGAAAIMHTMNMQHQGTSDTGSLQFTNMGGSIGNGTDPITVDGVIGLNIYPQINGDVEIDGGILGVSVSLSLNALTTFGSGGYVNVYGDTNQMPGTVGSYTTFNISPNIGTVANNANYTGINLNPNITTLDGNANATFINISGTITNLSSSGFSGLNLNTTIADLTTQSFGLNISPQVTTGTANFTMLQLLGGAINTSGQIRGIQVDVGNAINDLALDIVGHSNISSNFEVLSGQVQQYGHVIGGQVIIPDATAVTGTDVLANNMAFTVDTGDATSDYTAAGLVGITTLGFVGQIIGDGAVNGDVIFCLNGYSDAHNGHVDRVINFSAAAIPGGGTGTMDESILFYGQQPFGLVATDNWGLRIDTAALENYLAGSLAIGDMSSKKVANSSVALEIDSTTKAFVLPRMTTTERNALTAINGMQIYNVTDHKFQGYANGAWVDLH